MRKPKSNHYTWTLGDECRYLDGLGTWRIVGKCRDRAELLQQYISMHSSTALLEDWRMEAVEYAKRLLKKEQEKEVSE